MKRLFSSLPWLNQVLQRRSLASPPKARPVRCNFILTPGISQIFLIKVLQLGQPSVAARLAGLMQQPAARESGLEQQEILRMLFPEHADMDWQPVLKLVQKFYVTPAASAPAAAHPVSLWRENPLLARGVEELRPIVDALAMLKVFEGFDSNKTPNRPEVNGSGFTGRYQAAADTLAGLVQETLSALPPDLRGAREPLGAELSTLLHYAYGEGRQRLDLKGTRMVILASHSWQGLMAARLLQRVFCDYWEMEVPSENVQVVDDLVANPNNANTAMENLALKIQSELRGSLPGDSFQWENTFVMTSGFKSVIPCMTVFALIYGVEMIYTFEASDQIQTLHPRYNLQDPQSRNFWMNTWQGMRKEGWAGDSASSYLRVALQGRLEDVQLTFSTPS